MAGARRGQEEWRCCLSCFGLFAVHLFVSFAAQLMRGEAAATGRRTRRQFEMAPRKEKANRPTCGGGTRCLEIQIGGTAPCVRSELLHGDRPVDCGRDCAAMRRRRIRWSANRSCGSTTWNASRNATLSPPKQYDQLRAASPPDVAAQALLSTALLPAMRPFPEEELAGCRAVGPGQRGTKKLKSGQGMAADRAVEVGLELPCDPGDSWSPLYRR